MKNLNKKMIALTMILGFANISANLIYFTPTTKLYPDVNVSANPGEAILYIQTKQVKIPNNNIITYFDIKDIVGYEEDTTKYTDNGYTIIGYYGNQTQRKNLQSDIKQHWVLAKNYTR